MGTIEQVNSERITSPPLKDTILKDFRSGLVVSLVALPLCLGIALASNAPLISGLTAGIVGGLLISWLSGSHTSVSGPAAGLTAVVITQIEVLGSFNAFLCAVSLAGVMQLGLFALRAGSLAGFFPSSVIKGLLAAIGVILILKQLPHLFGHDPDWLGDMSFFQPDGENTFSELFITLFDIHEGPTIVGLVSVALLLGWNLTPLQKLPLPAPLFVVLGALGINALFHRFYGVWEIGDSHLVKVPLGGLSALYDQLPRPDLSVISRMDTWIAAFTICMVASLETLLNLEAVDKIDPKGRTSPANRELLAQGVGNFACGFLGALPVTSVIVRSSVNISSGGETRHASFIHGLLLVLAVGLFPDLLNMIPLACLAAILLVTGFKLASPKLFVSMWREGYSQFIPFFVTVSAIVLTDLLKGILIGLTTAVIFILRSNLQRPIQRHRHVDGSGMEITRYELGSHVSFLNRAALHGALGKTQAGDRVVIDARRSEYIDADVLDLIRDFEEKVAPSRGLSLSLLGFEKLSPISDKRRFVMAPTASLQQTLSPAEVLARFMDGNERFVRGESHHADLRAQVNETADGQHPLAVVLSCIDARLGTERIFDTSIGEAFSVRIAGNVISRESIGSIELGCLKAGAKLVIVLGHTDCGMIRAAVDAYGEEAERCDHTHPIIKTRETDLLNEEICEGGAADDDPELLDRISERNVHHSIEKLRTHSSQLRELLEREEIMLVGGLYDVRTGRVKWLASEEAGE